MIISKNFKPYHINANADDLAGNDGIGRYIFIPGSDGRARDIAQQFDHLTVKAHPRCYNLYLGTISHQGKTIDVASIASGIGCPSMDIIFYELSQLGGKRFLRVGTAGTMQSKVKIGDIVNAQSSVRDESTTSDYAPIELPAIASYEFIAAIAHSADKLGLSQQLWTGSVHCKSSFYGREFGVGPRGKENLAYMQLLTECGVLATEMETAALFIQTQLQNHLLMQQGTGPQYRVLSGAILSILSVPPHRFATPQEEVAAIENLIKLAFETVKTISAGER